MNLSYDQSRYYENLLQEASHEISELKRSLCIVREGLSRVKQSESDKMIDLGKLFGAMGVDYLEDAHKWINQADSRANNWEIKARTAQMHLDSFIIATGQNTQDGALRWIQDRASEERIWM